MTAREHRVILDFVICTLFIPPAKLPMQHTRIVVFKYASLDLITIGSVLRGDSQK